MVTPQLTVKPHHILQGDHIEYMGAEMIVRAICPRFGDYIAFYVIFEKTGEPVKYYYHINEPVILLSI
jgi:hypothetical protein